MAHDGLREDAGALAIEPPRPLGARLALALAVAALGWLAAYLGSALTSPTDLSFRNLGGTAVSSGSGILRTPEASAVADISVDRLLGQPGAGK